VGINQIVRKGISCGEERVASLSLKKALELKLELEKGRLESKDKKEKENWRGKVSIIHERSGCRDLCSQHWTTGRVNKRNLHGKEGGVTSREILKH